MQDDRGHLRSVRLLLDSPARSFEGSASVSGTAATSRQAEGPDAVSVVACELDDDRIPLARARAAGRPASSLIPVVA
jgi:hypothetical protein